MVLVYLTSILYSFNVLPDKLLIFLLGCAEEVRALFTTAGPR